MTFLLRTSALTLHTSSILKDSSLRQDLSKIHAECADDTADADGDHDEVGPLPLPRPVWFAE